MTETFVKMIMTKKLDLDALHEAGRIAQECERLLVTHGMEAEVANSVLLGSQGLLVLEGLASDDSSVNES